MFTESAFVKDNMNRITTQNQTHQLNLENYETLLTKFEHLYFFYHETIEEIQQVANTTSFQLALYNEMETFQSVHILKDFMYPYELIKSVKPKDFAMVAENDTSKELKTHKIYLLNSNVCLEDDWKRPQKIVEDSIEDMVKLYNSETDEYQCDEPTLKLVKEKIETETEQYNLKKFHYDKESVVKFEVHLSSMQKTSKRTTP